MKRLLSTLAILAVVTIAEAQKVSHTFRDVSMSEALRQLNEQSSDYTIHFLYNELEDFRVTTSFRNKRLPEAIQQMIGFYPIRMEIVTNQIFVECTHKAAHYLTGTIVDEQGQPVAYANVYLLSPSDSTVIGGGVSNEAGLFVIPCDEQDVMARISFVGYKTIYRRCKTSDLGTIRMQPDSYRLNGIEVKGARPLVRIKDDAFVTTVEGSYLSKMGTASEVLNHVPGVLSNGANVEVLGRGTPIIYINGRQMRNQSELGQLSSDQIKDIEVVMTPGAKYDASVRSVIRIKTIRPVGEGFSFSSKTMVGTNGHIIGQEEVNLNYRVGGLDIFSMADYEDFRMSATNTSRQDTYLRHHYMQHHVTSFCPHTNIYDGKLGFNYVFNDHHSLGMTYTAASRPSKQNSDMLTTTYQDDVSEDELTGKGREDVKRTEHMVNAYYSGRLGKWTLDANADMLFQREANDALTIENARVSEDRTVTTRSEAKNRLYAAKMVAGCQLWQGKLEFGAEGSTVHRTDFFANQERIISGSDTKTKETDEALFAELTQRIGKLSAKIGLRYEHVDSRFYGQIMVVDTNRTYHDLFPSAMLSYPLGNVQTRLSYARNIGRPAFAQLSSDLTYINRYLYESGNPYLRPTYRDNLSLALNWRWMTVMIDYAHVHDYIISTYSTYSNDPNIALLRKDNTSGFNNLQAMLHVAPTLGCYHPQLMLAVMWQDLEVEYMRQTKKMNQPMSIVRFNNAVNLPYDIWLNADLSWRSAGDSENIHLGQSWQFDLSLYKSFLRDRLSLKLSCKDVFASMRQDITIYSGIHQFHLDKRTDNRSLMLTVQYHFNPAKSKYRGQGAGNDVKSRL